MIWCGLDIATEFSEALSSRFDNTSNDALASKPDVFSYAANQPIPFVYRSSMIV